jgi:hypothetical protein
MNDATLTFRFATSERRSLLTSRLQIDEQVFYDKFYLPSVRVYACVTNFLWTMSMTIFLVFSDRHDSYYYPLQQ